MRGTLRLLVLATIGMLAAADLQAQLRYLCFGDSITLGNFDDTFEPDLGYPGRLEFASRLDCAATGCEVVNKGKSGEKTPGGLTRIDSVLDNNAPFDVLLLMEGTNDIWVGYDKSHPTWSYETMIFNLEEMARKAEDRGTDAVHASVIHLHNDAEADPPLITGELIQDVHNLRDDMESAALANARYFVDIWDVLCPESHPDVHGHNWNQCFNQHYPPVPEEDDRGHPNGSGYTMMADEFYNVIISKPEPGVPFPVSPSGGTTTDVAPTFTWTRESPVRATWYRLQVREGGVTVYDTWIKASDYCDSSSCSFRQPNLEDGSYSWRVRGRNPKDFGPWTSYPAFNVSFSGIFWDGFESGSTSGWSVTLP